MSEVPMHEASPSRRGARVHQEAERAYVLGNIKGKGESCRGTSVIRNGSAENGALVRGI